MWPRCEAQMWSQDWHAKLECGFVNKCMDYWMTQMWPESNCKAQMWRCWHVHKLWVAHMWPTGKAKPKCGSKVPAVWDSRCEWCTTQIVWNTHVGEAYIGNPLWNSDGKKNVREQILWAQCGLKEMWKPMSGPRCEAQMWPRVRMQSSNVALWQSV
jgi:hypothetical protein